jgi:hypothetical protein
MCQQYKIWQKYLQFKFLHYIIHYIIIFKLNLKIHICNKTYIEHNFLVFINDLVTHLHHKWCVHSILPLAPRAKQPVRHVYTCSHYRIQWRQHLISCHTNTNTTVHWAVELAQFRLAAGGGERSGPNMLLWLLFSFVLGLRGGRGATLWCLNVSETARMLWDATWANNANCALVAM